MHRPKLGVSACLVGRPVRFSGDYIKHPYITDVLSKFVDFHPVCPEMSMGLGAPRPAMRLVTDQGKTRIQLSNTGEDKTALAESTIESMLTDIPDDLDGFVLTKGSPMCGVERVKSYRPEGGASRDGVGMFTAALREKRPDLLIIESGRLFDPFQRAQYLTKLYTWSLFRQIRVSNRDLEAFHRRNKLLFLAFGRKHLTALGQIIARPAKDSWSLVAKYQDYREALRQTLDQSISRGRLVDALQHAVGYFRKSLGPDTRRLLRQEVQLFEQGTTRFSTIGRLMLFEAKRQNLSWLTEQTLWNQFPIELGSDIA